ncbi:DUF4062 domain-containing protein [Psychrobacter sp. DAB_AL62B]|uniref:DUF4062 domain-containing protein n=1 Tax=Psychrobacter sp. DAB_AL62B TaxID=1028420 RepID=UPI0023810215|nr:DUF4062 domain-containing protein [Psychrobacter sp. DAB_AL62B]MDE4455916.1 DUF4062 domain-containing protein [Psychrobacter sp. DAB_AL62B]
MSVPNRRYHIHVICADNDQLLVLDSVAVFFQARAFLTYDVSSKLPKASLYGRQCIDACDYALMIIGDSYGTAQNTGVSQMHLSYLNAKAKLKPLLILVKKHHSDAIISRQLNEFTSTVIKKADKIYYYETENDIESLLVQAYYKMVANHEVSDGWVRVGDEALMKSNKPAVSEESANILSTGKVTKQADSVVPNHLMPDSVSKPIVLTETFEIQYKAQAYEGGNLTDVTRSMLLTWQEVLIALIKIPATFSSYGLQSAINRLVATRAEPDIKREMPNVHAVSRCQISQDDLNQLQRQLVAANWIQLTTYGTRVTQELWKLTFYAKGLLVEKKPTTENPRPLPLT